MAKPTTPAEAISGFKQFLTKFPTSALADNAQYWLGEAHYVTKAEGGFGAVREVVELPLKAQGLWGGILKHYEIGGDATSA